MCVYWPGFDRDLVTVHLAANERDHLEDDRVDVYGVLARRIVLREGAQYGR